MRVLAGVELDEHEAYSGAGPSHMRDLYGSHRAVLGAFLRHVLHDLMTKKKIYIHIHGVVDPKNKSRYEIRSSFSAYQCILLQYHIGITCVQGLGYRVRVRVSVIRITH